MSVPASDPIPAPARKEPYFAGAFFWFVAWRILLNVAFMVGTFAYFFIAGTLFPENAEALLEQTESLEEAANVIGIIMAIILCVFVAGRYQLGFGKGTGLFFAGSVAANLICLPLYGVAMMGDEDGGMGWLAGLLLLILAYTGGCVYLMWRKRKELVAIKAQTAAIATFD